MTDIPERIAARLDPTMEARFVGSTVIDGVTWFFVDQFDDDGGEMVMIHELPGMEPEIVDSLPEGDPLAGGAALSPELAERFQAWRGEPAASEPETPDIGDDGLAGGGLDAQTGLNIKFHDKAVICTGIINGQDLLKSKDAPGTSGGRLACAWAVNEVARASLKKPVGGGLATAEMIKVLAARDKEINAPVPGCVIISPSVTRANGERNIGHVGIVGVPDGGVTPVYSNSSKYSEFQRNFTLTSWKAKYATQKGLAVRYFNLDPARFPDADTTAPTV